MSTRCNFGYIDGCGHIHTHYCHHDGYVTGVGKYLQENVQGIDAVKELMAAGDRSAISDAEGYPEAQAREELVFADMQELSNYLHCHADTQFCYLWDCKRGRWLYSFMRHDAVRHVKVWSCFIQLDNHFIEGHAWLFPLLGADDTMALHCADFFDGGKYSYCYQTAQDIVFLHETISGIEARLRAVYSAMDRERLRGVVDVRALTQKLEKLEGQLKETACLDHISWDSPEHLCAIALPEPTEEQKRFI